MVCRLLAAAQVGERLSVGVTLVLTIEVSRSAVAAVLPVCGELLWLEVFFMLNLMFTCISLAESCVVLSLAYYTGEDPLPAHAPEPRQELGDLQDICRGI